MGNWERVRDVMGSESLKRGTNAVLLVVHDDLLQSDQGTGLPRSRAMDLAGSSVSHTKIRDTALNRGYPWYSPKGTLT
jgi:hypothetical protein